MRLTVLGSSPAWPNPGSAQSGYLVEGRARLLLDCGPGVLARLRQRAVTWPPADAIAVTHLHLDHIADLVGWQWAQLMGPGSGSAPVPLWLPPGAASSPELASLLHRADEAFELREYRPRAPFEAAGFRITALPAAHYERVSFGLRVEDGERVLAYSGDTAPTPALRELAAGADVFLCEATLAEAEREPRGHLTADEALDAARAAGARRTLLTHRPAELPSPDGCELAYDGLELEVKGTAPSCSS